MSVHSHKRIPAKWHISASEKASHFPKSSRFGYRKLPSYSSKKNSNNSYNHILSSKSVIFYTFFFDTETFFFDTEKMLDKFEKDDARWKTLGKKLGFDF